jgi:hypothetical protein
LIVDKRNEVRWPRAAEEPGGKLDIIRGLWDVICDVAEYIEDVDAECECLATKEEGLGVCWPRFEVELAADTLESYCRAGRMR